MAIAGIGLGATLAILAVAAAVGLVVTTMFGVETRGDLDQAEALD